MPQLVHRGPVTLSAQIADWLRDRIKAGEFTPMTDPLPSETTLEQELGVSRPTIRKAIEILRDDGLVITVPQRGTFVAGDLDG